MLNTELKYKVRPCKIYCDDTVVDINAIITNRDIGGIFRFPKIGKSISFGEAYRLRLDKLSDQSVYGIPFKGDFSMSLPHWVSLYGYFIEFDENEIAVIKGGTI